MNRLMGLSPAALVAGLAALAACATAHGQFTSAPIRDSKKIFTKETISWQDLRESYVVMQQREYSCGAAAVSTIIQYYWDDPVTEYAILRHIVNKLSTEELKDRMKNGLSMTDLRKGATELGYPSVIGTRTFDELYEVKVPLVVRLQKEKFKHFVVFRGIAGKHVYLADSIRGNITYTIPRFLEEWTDGAVLVVSKKDAVDLPEYSPLMVHCDELLQPEMQWVRSRINRRPTRALP
jgi:predicted double-glycine peptidase